MLISLSAYVTPLYLVNFSFIESHEIISLLIASIYCLNKPHVGIYLPKMVWKDMYDFSVDSVLLVLASEHYDNTEYIRNYDEFKAEVQKLHS